MNGERPVQREAADQRRLQRIEELGADLDHKLQERRAYARQTLLTMLWLGDDSARCDIVRTVCRSRTDDVERASDFAERMVACIRFVYTGDKPVSVIDREDGAAHGHDMIGTALARIIAPAVQKLRLTLDGEAATEDDLYNETDLCRDTLTMANYFIIDTVVAHAVTLLRLFPPVQSGGTGPLARQTCPLRDAASRLLGAISPDKLYEYWYALGSPEPTARRDLLPVVDYINDPMAIPYLVRLFERRGQWVDGEMVGWFVVRALKRIRDRRALPALRRVVNMDTSMMLVDPASYVSPDLIREVRLAIEAIEYERSVSERGQLLRGSQPPVHQLVRAAPSGVGGDLVRPSYPGEEDLVRPANPESDYLLRPVADTGQLLHVAQMPDGDSADRSDLLRWSTQASNPFDNFDPLTGV